LFPPVVLPYDDDSRMTDVDRHLLEEAGSGET
jgi:hypothetical protein